MSRRVVLQQVESRILRTIGRVGLSLAKRSGSITLEDWARGLDEPGNRISATRPYEQITWVRAGIDWMTGALTGVPFVLSRGRGDGDTIVESGPLYELTQQPNPNSTRRTFVRDTMAFLMLDGIVFWVATQMSGLRPTELAVVPRRCITAVRRDGNRGPVIGYVYTTDEGEKFTLTLDEVRVLREFNPYHSINGLSRLKASQTALDTERAAAAYNRSVFENMGEPGGVLQCDAALNDEQYEQLKSRWRARHTGPENARRVAILEAGLKWQDVARAQVDMQYLEGREFTARELATAIGCPIEVFAIQSDSNRSISLESKLNCWDGRLKPYGDTIAEEFHLFVVAPYDRNVYAWFDWDTVEVYQEVRLAKTESAARLWDRGVPMEDLNRAYDLGLPDRPWHGTGWVPATFVPAELAGEPVVGLPEGDAGEAGDSTLAALRLGPAGPAKDRRPFPTPTRDGAPDDTRVRKPNKAQAHRIWVAWVNSWRGLWGNTRRGCQAHFRAQRKELLEKIDAALRLASLAPSPAEGLAQDKRDGIARRDTSQLASINIDLVRENQRLRVRVGPLVETAVKLGGTQAVAEAAPSTGSGQAAGVEFLAEDPAVIAAIKRRVNRLTGINAATYRRVQKIIADAIAGSETTAEAAAEIQETIKRYYNYCTGSRAVTIATTETAGAVNEGRTAGFRQAGIQQRMWVSARDANVRASHADADGEVVGIYEPFIVGGSQLAYPGDPAGPAAETINCRCTAIAVSDDGAAAYMVNGFVFVNDARLQSPTPERGRAPKTRDGMEAEYDHGNGD